MRIVYRAENIIDAHLVKHALEDAGIPAHVGGEYLVGALGDLPLLGLVNVMVADHHEAQAQDVVQRIDEALAESREQAAMDPGWAGEAL
ncbi:DUF2007 domain-containing protein [Tahibacter amnicola]|uniref:DUF2007 domain-containing protein n=1 Tax=Tahibacter amnicola TaxID=2976241 RepID=A0ABY6BDJ1_9GAMM|nr:DUF2007 domain-containing protein [Tahibacter amnicola]UXI67651.1 DUF2007 domain-containing protein [Tahibacter amnicola]